jgi:hypothetical protein
VKLIAACLLTFLLFLSCGGSGGGDEDAAEGIPDGPGDIAEGEDVPDVSDGFDDTVTGNLYYVSTSGDDGNPGTQEEPWATIQKAADTMAPGDGVIVLEGSYASERVHVTTSGRSDAPIAYLAQGAVVMKGFTVTADYITIRGFEITDTDVNWQDGVGIFVVQCIGCLIEGNYIHFAANGGITLWAETGKEELTADCVVRGNRLWRNCMQGVMVHGRNNLIEGNEVWGTIQHHPGWTESPTWLDADGMRFFGRGHVFLGNFIHDITFADEENVDPHIDCFQTWSGDGYEAGSAVVFEKNFCNMFEGQAPNETTQGFMVEGDTSDLVIRNNILRTYRGLNILDSVNLTVVNNTFPGDPSALTDSHPSAVSITSCTGVTIENNLFYDIPGHAVYNNGSTLASAGKNMAYRSDGQPLWTTDTYDHAGDLWDVDPLLVDPAAFDYRLQDGSPAIDAGFDQPSLVPDDYDGVTRPQGAGWDIGAFEHP